MTAEWVLAVDLGTSGLKVGAVGIDGSLLSVGFAPVATTLVGRGGAEQDPGAWWHAVLDLVAEVTADDGVDPTRLVAVGLTGQWASTVPVDAQGRPVGPCLLWSDDRGRPYSREVIGGPALGYHPRWVVEWLRYTGGAPSPNGADPTGHALFLQHERPDVLRDTAVLLEPVDFLGLRLTGRAAATPASMTASWLTDNRPGRPLRYVPELVRRSGRDPRLLPPLLASGSVLGGVSASAAAELGLPSGVPVACGVPDLHAAYLASGAVGDHQGHVTISTTSWVSAAVPFKKTDVLHQITSIPGVRPGSYLVADNQETAGVCLEWLRDAVIAPDDGLGPRWTPTYDDLIGLAEKAPVGSSGVLFTPWLKGERSPVDDRDVRAAFLNLSVSTTRGDLVRAVLEGVAYNSRWLMESVDRFAKQPLGTLRILGGGAQSDLWCQVFADVTGRRIERVADPMHAQLRGVAFGALLALGRFDLDDIAHAVPVTDVFEPDPAAGAAYAPLYRAFTKTYPSLKGMYARLNR